MIVLGVDPGSLRTGYGAVRTDGRRHSLIETGALAPRSRLSLPARLREIHAGISELIARLQPDVLAVEDVFHAVNSRTALVLGHVRGVVLLAGAQAGLAVVEYPPATVKQQVAGCGRAEKGQVAYMVTRMLELTAAAAAGDATDALAVALCCACLDARRVSAPSSPRARGVLEPEPPRTPGVREPEPPRTRFRRPAGGNTRGRAS